MNVVHKWIRPPKKALIGKYCCLEPLKLRHANELFEVGKVGDAEERYRFLREGQYPPRTKEAFDIWIETYIKNEDKECYAIIDSQTNRLVGTQSYLHMQLEHGTIEIGSIMWGPEMARTRKATEAFYLFADYVLSELGYRRLEWKCDNANEASKAAALRLGFTFEALFRNHMMVKGKNRDTAWHSITDKEWPGLRESFVLWLDEANFTQQGQQRRDLRTIRAELTKPEKAWLRPPKKVLIGKYCRLEPVNLSHADSLYENAVNVPDALERYKYLYGRPPLDRTEYDKWIQNALVDSGKIRFVILDHDNRALGSQCLMNLETSHGSVEIGSVLFGPSMARSRIATEAFFLLTEYAMSELGYRRYEWKCNNSNLASRKAAERFGFQFEGVFRNHMVVDGVNRDTAWFSITDTEWPVLRESYVHWLSATNFDSDGKQLRNLRSFRRV